MQISDAKSGQLFKLTPDLVTSTVQESFYAILMYKRNHHAHGAIYKDRRIVFYIPELQEIVFADFYNYTFLNISAWIYKSKVTKSGHMRIAGTLGVFRIMVT